MRSACHAAAHAKEVGCNAMKYKLFTGSDNSSSGAYHSFNEVIVHA